MMNRFSWTWKHWVACLGVLVGLFLPNTALAVGTVTISNKEPTETDGRWKLQMTINYGSVPHMPHIPMLFVFTPSVHYERALTDQSPEKPVLNKIPLSNQQAMNESTDVGFSDSTGKVFATTKFDIVLRRDRGYEAGEYTLVIKREGDGVTVGQPQKIKLLGDNPVVDRRAMVFAGEKPKKASEEEKPKSQASDSADNSPKPESPVSSEPIEEASTANAPPPVPPKQGGCGCLIVPVSEKGSVVLPLGAVIAIGALRRRNCAVRRPNVSLRNL